MDIDLGSTVVAAEGHFSSRVAGETVILSERTGVYFGLDPIASRIWGLVEGPVTVRTIRDVLMGEFDVDMRRCEDDVLRLLRDLVHHGLLQVLEASESGDEAR